MTIKSDCENLLAVLSQLDSLHAESESSYKVAAPLLETVTSQNTPEAIAKVDDAKKKRAEAQERLRAINGPGKTSAQFAALEKTIFELRNEWGDARSKIDSAYDLLKTTALDPIRTLSLQLREAIGNLEGRQQILQKLVELGPPSTEKKEVEATFLQPIARQMPLLRDIASEFEAASRPGDFRKRLEHLDAAREKSRGLSAEVEKQALMGEPVLRKASDFVSGFYEYLERAEIMKDMVAGILEKISCEKIRTLSSKVGAFAKLNPAIDSDALNLRAKVEIMASIAENIDELSK